MATTITLKGDSKSAEQSLDAVIRDMDAGDKSARKVGAGLDVANKSLATTEARAKAAAATFDRKATPAVSRFGAAAKSAGGKVAGMAGPVAGLGSALGVQGSGLASAAVGLGSFGIAAATAGAAVAASVSIYRDWNKQTSDVAENHNFAVRAIKDAILWTGIYGDVIDSTAKRDQAFANSQLKRMNEVSVRRRKLAGQASKEAGEFAAALQRLVKDEFIGKRAVQKFGDDQVKVESRLIELADERNELLAKGSKLFGISIEQEDKRESIRKRLVNLQAEEIALQQRSTALDQSAAQQALKDVGDLKKRTAELKKIEDDKLKILDKQEQSRKSQLALMFKSRDAATGTPDAGPDNKKPGKPKSGGVGGVGEFFGQANRAIGQFNQAPRRFGINVRPRQPRADGAKDPASVAKDFFNRPDRTKVLGRVADERFKKQATGDEKEDRIIRKRIRKEVFSKKGKDRATPGEVSTAQKEIANADIDRLTKQKGFNDEAANAAKAKVALLAAHSAELAQKTIDIQNLTKLVDAMANQSRGRFQRSGR